MLSHLDSNGAEYTILGSKFLSFNLHMLSVASLRLLVWRSLGVPVVSCILLQLWDSFFGFDVLKCHCVVCLGHLSGALCSVHLSSSVFSLDTLFPSFIQHRPLRITVSPPGAAIVQVLALLCHQPPPSFRYVSFSPACLSGRWTCHSKPPNGFLPLCHVHS